MQVSRIARFINNSPKTQKMLRAINDSPAMALATSSFIAASILRPSAIMCLPIDNKKDKAYTVGSAVATGVSELGLSALLFIPAKKVICNASKYLHDAKGTIYEGNKIMLRNFKSLNNRMFKLASLPLASFARFALVAPFVKLLFGKEKKK